MVKRCCGNTVGIHLATEMPVADDGKRMGQGCHLPGMGSHILLNGIAHQPPAFDPTQAGDIGEKVAGNITHRLQTCFALVHNLLLQVHKIPMLF